MGRIKQIFLLLASGSVRYHNRNSLFDYGNFLSLQRFTPQLQYMDRILSPGRRVGSPLMEPFRMFGRLLQWKVCYGEHNFEFKLRAGETGPKLNARSLFEFSKNYVGQTVPGAMRGEGGILMGRRGQNELTTAVFGGPVRTTHNDEEMTMRNYAEPGHLFSEGYLDIRFVDEDGSTFMILKGGGYNNFSSFNQFFGSRLFPRMGQANINAYKRSLHLPD